MIKVHFGEEKVEIDTPIFTYGTLPTTTQYNYAISQQIFTKTELGEARTFNSISFYNESLGRYRIIDLYLVPTSKEKFNINVESDSGDNSTDWLSYSEDNLVFSGEATFANDGWSTITFDTPFEYDGSSSVAIIMNDRTGSFVGSTKFRTISSDDVSIYACNDDAPYTSSGLESVVGTVETYRNLIKINEEEILPKNIYLPTYTYYNYSLSQQIYTSTEIGGAKDLTSVSFFSAGAERTRNLDIYLVPTFKDYFNSETAWEPVTEADKVFSGQVTFGMNKWTAIPFNKAYHYGGTGNLVLVVDDNTGTYQNGVPFLTFQATEQSISVYADSYNYDPLDVSSYNGTVRSVKNQVRFNDKELAVPNATNLAVSDIAWNTATITWEGDAETYNLQYRPYGYDEWTSKYAIEGKSYTLTNLEEQTKYEVRVQINGYGLNEWVSTTFATVARFAAPSDVEIVALTPYSAAVKWTDNCGASNWEISIAGSSYITSNNPFIVTGLTPDTYYALSVHAVMYVDGETLYSNWTSDIHFTTPVPNPAPTDIAVTTTPSSASIAWEGQSESYKVHYRKAPNTFFFEDFEGEVSGWTVKDFNSGSGIMTYGLNDSYALAFHYTTDPPQYVVTPELSGVTEGAVLEFYYRNKSASYPESFKVGYSTTTNDLDDTSVFTWSEEVTLDRDTEWYIYTQAVPAGVKYVSIQCTSNDMFYLVIDNVSIYIPTNDDWQTIETAEKQVTIEGLDSDTEYQFEVVGVMMGQEDASKGIATFTTLEVNPVPFDVVVNAYASSADISWKGYSDSYIITYRSIEEEKTTFFDDFESGDLSTGGWTIYTNGEAPKANGWYVESGNAYSGSYVAVARSWYADVVYDADNWLITPWIELGGRLTFYQRVNSSYPDSYAVLLSTTTMATSDFTTELRSLQPGFDSGNWTEITIDLSDYEGQKGYIAIHHQDNDKDWLNIDDFGVYSATYGQLTTSMVNGTEFTMEGLTPGTTYEVKITGVKAGEPDAETETFYFTTGLTEPVDVTFDNKNNYNQSDVFANNGVYANVTISNLTLRKDGTWQSIVLPFEVSVDNSVLKGADVRTLESVERVDDIAILNFNSVPLSTMSAGYPYIIKWNGGEDIVDPVFKGVTIDKNMSLVEVNNARYTFDKYNYYMCSGDYPGFYHLTGSTTLSPLVDGSEVDAFTGYFDMTSGVYYGVKTIYLNTGDDDYITGLRSLKGDAEDEVIFNVAGQRLSKKQKGVNIVNGKKVLVK